MKNRNILVSLRSPCLYTEIYENLKKKQARHEKYLYPSGRTIFFQEMKIPGKKGIKSKIKCSEVEDKFFFAEILFLDGFFSYHYPHIYQEMIGSEDIVI